MHCLITTETSRLEATVLRLRHMNWTRFAVGSAIRVNSFDKWVKERLTGLNTHVPYIHIKYMLIDPGKPLRKWHSGSLISQTLCASLSEPSALRIQ